MKKFFLIPFILIFMVACSNNTQEDKILLIDKINQYNADISAISNQFDKEFVNIDDKDQALSDLQNHIIPKFNELNEKVSQQRFNDEECEEVFSEYKKIVAYQMKLYEDYESSLLNDKQEVFHEINEDLDILNDMSKEFKALLITFSNKYKIELK